MAIRMAKLTRTPTGLWTSRKAIPADVRAAYEKREEKPTWPATLTQGHPHLSAEAVFVAFVRHCGMVRRWGDRKKKREN